MFIAPTTNTIALLSERNVQVSLRYKHLAPTEQGASFFNQPQKCGV